MNQVTAPKQAELINQTIYNQYNIIVYLITYIMLTRAPWFWRTSTELSSPSLLCKRPANRIFETALPSSGWGVSWLLTTDYPFRVVRVVNSTLANGFCVSTGILLNLAD